MTPIGVITLIDRYIEAPEEVRNRSFEPGGKSAGVT
jgi:hypothetical protein